MLNKYLLLIFFPLCLLCFKAQASHVSGAEISYSPHPSLAQTYIVTLSVYTDCVSNIDPETSYSVIYRAGACNAGGTFNVTLQGMPINISPTCAAVGSICSGGTGPGILKSVYEGNVTLPKACADWRFTWEDCSRSSNINTIQNPQSTCIFIEARLNSLVAPGNTSPQFTNDPVSYFCTGQSAQFSNSTLEPDNDSIDYTLLTPRSTSSTTITYLSGYSASDPFSNGAAFDSQNGQLSISPTINLATATAVQAREYRNGVLVGTSMRDVQLFSIACGNNAPPNLTGVDSSNSYTIEACEGTPVTFSIFGSDPNPGQNLTIDFGNISNITNTSVTQLANGVVRGDIQFGLASGLSGTKTFTVNITDNACPISSTQTFTYTVDFTPRPRVSLGSDTLIPCPQARQLNAYPFDGGTPPFTYAWSTGDVSQIIFASDTGTYSVTVTDSKGCTGSASIKLYNTLFALPFKLPRCPGEAFEFADSSYSLSGTPLVSWMWDFGDGSTFSGQTPPPHTFPFTDSLYVVTLTVTDTAGCTATGGTLVAVYEPVITIELADSCVLLTGTSFVIKYEAPPIALNPFPPFIPQYYSPGIVQASLFNTLLNPFIPVAQGFSLIGMLDSVLLLDAQVAISDTTDYVLVFTDFNGCRFEIDTSVFVNPAPEVGFLEGIGAFDVCDRSDSVLNAFVYPLPDSLSYSLFWSDNFGDTIYFNDLLFDTLILPRSVAFTDSSTYELTAKNILGCESKAAFQIVKPFTSHLARTSYCEPGDTIFFSDSTRTLGTPFPPPFPIVSTTYTFGDGSIGTMEDPNHLYAPSGAYGITMTKMDSTGCVSTVTDSIFTFLPPDTFDIGDNTLCFDEPFEYFSPPRSNSVNRWIWNFGNGDSTIIRVDSLRNGTYLYPSPGTYAPRLTVIYNRNECVRRYDTTIQVYPQPKVDVTLLTGQCIDTDSTRITLVQSGGLFPLTNIQWILGYRQFGTTGFIFDTVQTSVYTRQFSEPGRVRSLLTVTDSIGCIAMQDTTVNVSRVSPPKLSASGSCANDVQLTNVPVADVYENQVEFSYDFGDGTFSSSVFRGETITHAYPGAGTYTVTLSVFDDFGCTDSYDTTVTVIDIPVAEFEGDTVCDGTPVVFVSTSRPPGSSETLVRQQWNFGDGSSDTTFQPSHIYPRPGSYNARLVVTSSTTCTDTAFANILVRARPKAGFNVSPDPLYSFEPIQFFDQAGSTVFEWLWLYGDGDSLQTDFSQDPFHTYTSVDTFQVMQVVTDRLGCKDTARLTLDLNIYVALPNAFSPNGDRRNDLFHLLYPQSRADALDLLAFRVYNRYGETVFDAQGDIDRGWDGTHNGKAQEPGVFVYFAKILTKYGDEIILEGNVTLLK